MLSEKSLAMKIMKKIVLAYSGGLDTTATIPWLKENYDAEVICVCVNVGQGELEGLEERALKYGAQKCIIINCVDEFVEDFAAYILKANAKYEGKYLLGTSIARPIISQKLVEVALAEDAYAICHGATGKGNDQVRFELAIKALAPQLEIIAPWRIWDIKSREDATAYLESRNFEAPTSKSQSYSRDANLWHVSSEGLELEDPSIVPDLEKVLTYVNTPEQAPDTPEYIDLEFEKGIPVSLNGEKMSFANILIKLNEIGAKHGVGIDDIVENRVVGMKSRGVYETPGGSILYYGHNQVEQLTLDRESISFKATVSQKFAEIVYAGQWFLPINNALIAYIDSTQEVVSGSVKLKLYKGNITNAGCVSPNSLYIEDLASFTTGDLFDHKDAEGFINLFGLPSKVNAMINSKEL